MALVGASALSACGSVSRGDDIHSVELVVEQAWARSTPATAQNGVVYLSITSPVPDELIGVKVPSDVARSAEIHESMSSGGESPMANMPGMAAGGSMTMVPIDSVPLAAGATLVFQPGGKHIMLSNLQHPLRTGTHFTATLQFRVHRPVSVDVEVRDSPPEP